MPNAPSLVTALTYFRSVLSGRLQVYLGKEQSVAVQGAAWLEDAFFPKSRKLPTQVCRL